MITRDNYEEWLLLYADNELSVADRQVVERFIAGNPDLGEELQDLLQCRLDPKDAAERIIFTDKPSLMRYEQRSENAGAPNDAQINTINTLDYEAFFVQYIDGELDGGKRLEVEEFIRRYPSKGAELEVFGQTISQPDTSIVFPDKESLYKRTTGRKILLYPWWKMAAAAVLLGVAALLLFYSGKKTTSAVTPVTPSTFYSSETRKTTGAEKDSTAGKKENGPAIAQQREKTAGDKQTIAQQRKNRTTILGKHNGDAFSQTGDKPADKHQLVLAQTIPVKKTAKGMNDNTGKAGDAGDGKDGRHKEGPVVAVTDATQYNRNTALNGKPLRTEDHAIVAGDPQNKNGASFVDAVIPRDKSSFATQALLNDATTSAEDNSDTEPASPKKTKLRGFFRKVSRAFEKTADRGEESQKKILIGSFQFALN